MKSSNLGIYKLRRVRLTEYEKERVKRIAKISPCVLLNLNTKRHEKERNIKRGKFFPFSFLKIGDEKEKLGWIKPPIHEENPVGKSAQAQEKGTDDIFFLYCPRFYFL